MARLRNHAQPGANCSIYDEIKYLAKTFGLTPGTHLNIVGLADRLGVSSTPIREALNRLTAEELLVAVPNKGFFARSLSVSEMSELVHLLWMVVRWSAERLPPGNEFAHPGHDVDHSSRDASNLCRAFELLYCRIVERSNNISATLLAKNLCDRTHFVRLMHCQNLIDEGNAEGRRPRLEADRQAFVSWLDAHFGYITASLPRAVSQGLGELFNRLERDSHRATSDNAPRKILSMSPDHSPLKADII
jgi:hypothetical protein